MLTEEIKKDLVKKCLEMKKKAYCPYSNFTVGAAILSSTGKIFTGCNIENSSYGAAICAERCAICKTISEGETKIAAIAVTGIKRDAKELGNDQDFTYPCGICRQVLREFCDPKEMKVIVVASETRYKEHTLEELLPCSFGPESLLGDH